MCMFVWYAVPLQSTIIIHVSNYKTMCQVSSVHDRPRSIINYLFGSFLTINIRLSVVCTSRRFFRDLLCSAAPATVRCRLGGLRTSSWSWTKIEDARIYPRTSDTWRTAFTVRTPWRIPYIFIRPLCLRDDMVDARSFGSLNVLDTL